MATGSKVVQGSKGTDWETVVPRFGHCDMLEEDLVKAVAICKIACGQDHKYYKDFAMAIKTEMDKELGPSWHVIVGTQFGSFVSYETRRIALFWLEEKGFLLYKHG